MPTMLDLTGQRFGRLTVIERAEDKVTKSGRHSVAWKCVCDCGNATVVATSHLRSGDVTSCGCFHRERSSENMAAVLERHNLARTRIYHLYQNMKYRCNNPKASSYESYGGRGIKVCDEWSKEDGFINFYLWAVSHGYDDSLSIDRINVDGNYEPSNCRWTTNKEQCNNMRKTIWITYNGETKSAAQWAEEIGVSRYTIYSRIRKGKSVEEVLSPRNESKVRHKKA